MPNNVVEGGMEGAEVFDALDDAAARLGEAVLVIDHVPAREFRGVGEFFGPAEQIVGFCAIEEITHDEEAVAVHGVEFGLKGQAQEAWAGGCCLKSRAHAANSGRRDMALCTSSAKSISVQGRPVTSSKPNRLALAPEFGALLRIMSRIGSSYSICRRPEAT